jgi:hypothetical protein
MLLNSTSLYWFEAANDQLTRTPVAGGSAVSVAQAGGDPFESFGAGACCLAADTTNVYWATSSVACTVSGNIFKAPLGGGVATTLATVSCVNALAVDGSNVYWGAHGSVGAVPIAGGTPITLAQTPSGGHSLVLSDRLFWLSDVQPGSTVLSMPTSGGIPATIANTPLPAQSLAVDASSIYITTAAGESADAGASGQVLTAALSGGPTKALATVAAFPGPIAVDATSVYWAQLGMQPGQGSVMKLTPR